MDQPQRAQRFDETQLARLEFAEILVAGQQVRERTRRAFAIARQQQPQILDRGRHPAVVEVDEVRAGIGPQHVARMTVAVRAQQADLARPLERGLDAFERERHGGLIRGPHIVRNEIVREQVVARLVAERTDIEHGTRGIRLRRADRMDPADEAAEPFERVAAVEVRRASAAPLEDREAETVERVQRAAVECARGHRRNLARGELGDERMLFEDRFVRPAGRTVELRDDRRAVFDAHLIYAVFVAVEREQAPVGAQAGRHQHAVERVEHALGRESGERRAGGRSGSGSDVFHAPHCAASRAERRAPGAALCAQ